jgi:hypothetical protein
MSLYGANIADAGTNDNAREFSVKERNLLEPPGIRMEIAHGTIMECYRVIDLLSEYPEQWGRSRRFNKVTGRLI